jgi:hypothetical protein
MVCSYSISVDMYRICISLCILIAFSESDIMCGSGNLYANIASRSNGTSRYITIKMHSI